MRLDYDLIRELLLTIERFSDIEKNLSSEWISRQCTASNDNGVILYHLKFLADADYIELDNGNLLAVSDITPAGRAYLDSIRTQRMWDKVKSEVNKNLLPLSLDIIKLTALELIKKVL